MKCLSILEPWASGIVYGSKRFENRSWRTLHRGPLLIHAGKSRRLVKGADPLDAILAKLLPGLGSIEELRFGLAIGIVDVVDCVSIADVAGQAWAEGPWCWVLANPRPIEPFAMSGQLSLFEVADRLIVSKAA